MYGHIGSRRPFGVILLCHLLQFVVLVPGLFSNRFVCLSIFPDDKFRTKWSGKDGRVRWSRSYGKNSQKENILAMYERYEARKRYRRLKSRPELETV